MFGKIKYIADNIAIIENLNQANSMNEDLMNRHVVFVMENNKILGEVKNISETEIEISFLGEFINGKYISGVLRKPSLNSEIRIVNEEELKLVIGVQNEHSLLLGSSPIYRNFPICVDINNIFSNHLAIFGNSGSGKSCGVARIIQNIFDNLTLSSYNANIFIFDAYGEYKHAFSEINKKNPNYNYKFITTNPIDETDALLNIPIYLLNLDDMALLLQADNHSQLPIIERMLKLVKIFAKNDLSSKSYKNHLIAKALLAILFSNQTTASKKNEVFQIIGLCSTPEFSFDTAIQGLGYTRKLSECFEIDSNGNFGESVLINEYILSYLNDELENNEVSDNVIYSLKDLEAALDYTMISEGFQYNSTMYDASIILKVRIHTMLNTTIHKYFDFEKYISVEQYITNLVVNNNRKAQIININLEDIDDVYAKVMVKVISRLIFDFAKTRKNRAAIPFHLFLEEAHRYVQKDADTFLIGYNIFDRIAKEGRKYGVMLDIISQRPVELSDTVISQCSNFIIFKMTHPKDIQYIKEMLPNISLDVIEKQKSLQPGTAVGFGSAFKIPLIVKFEMPNPSPYSSNCDIKNTWTH